MQNASDESRAVALGWSVLSVVSGAAAVAASAQWTFALPGVDLPQTAQTLAVLLVGAALGRARGTLAVALYLAAGAVGLPVFAEGASGVNTLLGPSAGYLFGFVVAAAVVGRAAYLRQLARPWWRAFGIMLLAHAAILLLGGAALSARIGVADAWAGGVAPFVLGAVVKSALAAAVVSLIGERRFPIARTH